MLYEFRSYCKWLLISACLMLSACSEDVVCPGSLLPLISTSVFDTDTITLTPLDSTCQSTCANECAVFSAKDDAGIELNKGVQINCQMACQAGTLYSDYIYEEDPTTKKIVSKTLKTIKNKCAAPPYSACVQACNVSCTKGFSTVKGVTGGTRSYSDETNECISECSLGNNYNYVYPVPSSGTNQVLSVTSTCTTPTKAGTIDADLGYQSKVVVAEGDQIALRLDNSVENVVYMCGMKSRVLQPTIASYDDKIWGSNFQFLWGNTLPSPPSTGLTPIQLAQAAVTQAQANVATATTSVQTATTQLTAAQTTATAAAAQATTAANALVTATATANTAATTAAAAAQTAQYYTTLANSSWINQIIYGSVAATYQVIAYTDAQIAASTAATKTAAQAASTAANAASTTAQANVTQAAATLTAAQTTLTNANAALASAQAALAALNQPAIGSTKLTVYAQDSTGKCIDPSPADLGGITGLPNLINPCANRCFLPSPKLLNYDLSTTTELPAYATLSTQYTNESLWYLYNVKPAVALPPSMKLLDMNPLRECNWNARNPQYTVLNINPKDGDELSLAWSGAEASRQTISLGYNGPVGVNSSRRDLYTLYYNPTAVSSSTANAKPPTTNLNCTDSKLCPYKQSMSYDLFQKTTAFQIRTDTAALILPADKFSILAGEPNNTDLSGFPHIDCIGKRYKCNKTTYGQLQSVVLYPSGASWNGLKRRITDYNIVQPFNSGVKGCSTTDVPSLWDTCHPVTDPGFSEYNLAGKLAGYSSTNKSISLRHLEDGNYGSNFNSSTYNGLVWGDNLGGLTVKALWKGCPRYNGQGLEYAIAPDGSTGTLSWQSVPMDAFTQGNGFAAPTAGRLYFRMQPPAIPTGVDVKAGDYKNQSSRSGQYKFTVSKYNATSSCTDVAYGNRISNAFGGVISDIVNFVFTTMFGSKTDPSNPGVLANLFTALVQESPFIITVRALLVFYVAMSGLGFMMGLIQMNHTEMIKRLLKFTCVAVVISPGAWNFLYTNLFQMFIWGPLELIRIFLMGNGTVPGVCIDPNNPASIFKVFDVPFQLIFAEETWMKIGGLALSSITTLPTFLAAVIIFSAAVFIYVLTVAKVMMMYLMSIVILATLIFLSPVFICMILFNFTKFMFDNWWKNLLSFALQPAVMFSVIGIFNLFIIVALNSFLGFETEKKYLIHFSITVDTSKLNIGGPIPTIPTINKPFDFLPFCAPKYDTSGLSLTALTTAAGGLASDAGSGINSAVSDVNKQIGNAETGLNAIGQNLLQEGQQLGNQIGGQITSAGQTSISGVSGAATTTATVVSNAAPPPPPNLAQLQAAAAAASEAANNAYAQTVAQAKADLAAAQAAAGIGTTAYQQAIDAYNATIDLATSRKDAAIQSSQLALQSALNNSYNALQNTGNTIVNTFTSFNGPASDFGSSTLSQVASGINWASNQMTSLIYIILNVLVLLIFVHGMYIFAHFTPELIQRIVSGQVISQSSITAVGEKMFTNVLASASTTAASEYNRSYSVEQTSPRFDKVRGTEGRKR